MRPDRYGRFTSSLLDTLSSDPRVLGVIALGSMAGTSRQPDQWSDHDFFVITTPGAQEEFRQQTGWLPEPDAIALHFRETAHGCKAIWDDGHLAEYAVFDVEELNLARINDWRVLLDRERIAERMRAVESVTREFAGAELAPPQKVANELVSNLLIAGVRARRGERLSARVFLTYAMTKFASLLPRVLPSDSSAQLDNLDPSRRVERAYPEVAREVVMALRLEEEHAAVAVLELAARTLPSLVPERVVKAIRRAIEE